MDRQRQGEGFAVLLALLTSCCGGTPTGGQGGAFAPSVAATSTPTPVRPNIVLIMADDLDARATQELSRLQGFARGGTSFSRAYVTTAICGPSRISLLTGQYAHNHGAVFNSTAFPDFTDGGGEASSLAVRLDKAGYRTGLVGKYLNGYPIYGRPEYQPPGWDEWAAQLTTEANSRYFSYAVNENGRIVNYGTKQEDYDADVIGRKAAEFIKQTSDDPFFLYLAPQAPHSPATYPDRYAGAFMRAEAPKVPSFNEENISDKPVWLQGFALLTPMDIRRLDQFQQARLRSMMAVEELIDNVLGALAATNQLDKTYVIFTSDNGLLMGEHRLVDRKGTSYEECIRVPLFIRGPGVPAGRELAHPVLNIDIAPTLVALAGLAVPEAMDGRSLVPLLRGEPPGLESWRSDFVVEHYSTGVSAAVRSADWLYSESESGEVELYDMRIDPYQTLSLHRRVERTFLQPFSQRITTLLRCRGAGCRE